ncbi:hypothetical protein AB4Y40_39095 [Paraburkholderia sp. EG287B]|uniref:hypothetical protein n=1 Tax=Paraburkholderia sp. EG287B TaxID=3237010 RepID=UPI0034D2CAFC
MMTSIPNEPPALRFACSLLVFVQEHHGAVPYAGDASGVRDYVAGCFGNLSALMNDARALERFGLFTLELCQAHSSLTAAQGRHERRTKAGRRRAACAGLRMLVGMLDGFELASTETATTAAHAIN